VPNADVSKCGKLGVQRKELLDHPIGHGREKGGLDLVADKASPGLAMGDEKGEVLAPGSLFALPAGHVHHTWTENKEVIAQVNFFGPANHLR
jgi:hypothetical protein